MISRHQGDDPVLSGCLVYFLPKARLSGKVAPQRFFEDHDLCLLVVSLVYGLCLVAVSLVLQTLDDFVYFGALLGAFFSVPFVSCWRLLAQNFSCQQTSTGQF